MKALLLILGLLTSSPVAAQSVMELDFQGQNLRFDLDHPMSRAGFTRFMTVDAVSFEGVAEAARLVIELALPPSGDTPHDARIMFRPDGYRDYWLSPLVFPAGGVVIESVQLRGIAPHIAGEFETPLCFTASPLVLPDPARCDIARGRFQTELRPD